MMKCKKCGGEIVEGLCIVCVPGKLAGPTVICFEGTPITDLSREELYEAIEALMAERKYWVQRVEQLTGNKLYYD